MSAYTTANIDMVVTTLSEPTNGINSLEMYQSPGLNFNYKNHTNSLCRISVVKVTVI